MFGVYINLHLCGEGEKNSEDFLISDYDFYECVRYIKNVFESKNISSLSNEESNDTYFFVAPDMEIIGLSNDKYFSLGNINQKSINELFELKKNMKETLKNAQKNRKWTIKENGGV